jgi:chromosome segregation ATPase
MHWLCEPDKSYRLSAPKLPKQTCCTMTTFAVGVVSLLTPCIPNTRLFFAVSTIHTYAKRRFRCCAALEEVKARAEMVQEASSVARLITEQSAVVRTLRKQLVSAESQDSQAKGADPETAKLAQTLKAVGYGRSSSEINDARTIAALADEINEVAQQTQRKLAEQQNRKLQLHELRSKCADQLSEQVQLQSKLEAAKKEHLSVQQNAAEFEQEKVRVAKALGELDKDLKERRRVHDAADSEYQTQRHRESEQLSLRKEATAAIQRKLKTISDIVKAIEALVKEHKLDLQSLGQGKSKLILPRHNALCTANFQLAIVVHVAVTLCWELAEADPVEVQRLAAEHAQLAADVSILPWFIF